MSRWTMPEMNEDTPAIVRDAWRKQLFDDLAEKRTERENKAGMTLAALAGVIIGIAGSTAIFLFT